MSKKLKTLFKMAVWETKIVLDKNKVDTIECRLLEHFEKYYIL